MAESQTDEDLSSTIDEEELKDLEALCAKAWLIIQNDRTEEDLEKIQRYLANDMDQPYIPNDASTEYTTLAERSTSNWLIPALNAPAQALFLEDHRLEGGDESSPAFKAAFRRNKLAGRQSNLYRDALSYGESYLIALMDEREDRPTTGTCRSIMASRLKAVALYVDPVNDDRPEFFLYVIRDPESEKKPGKAIGVTQLEVFDVEISTQSSSTDSGIKISNKREHGASDTPVSVFCPYRDLTGAPRGIIRPLLPIQDRINQTIFDLMTVQSYGAFKVKFITGMVPPTKRTNKPITKAALVAAGADPDGDGLAGLEMTDVVDYESIELVDEDGNAVPDAVTVAVGRLLIVEEPTAKVGAIPETPLDGYIASIAMSVQHLAAIAQVPPQFLLGNIANLNGDALAALAASLDRMVAEFQHSFDESWNQHYRDIAEIEGLGGADDFNATGTWRDLTSRSLSQTVDALGKASTMLGIPQQGLWGKVPGTTSGDIASWKKMADDHMVNPPSATKGSLARSTTSSAGAFLNAQEADLNGPGVG